MTLLAAAPRCGWCGAVLPISEGPGRPRRYCRASHRQRAYEARLLAERMGLDAGDVLMTRRLVQAWQDALYVLAAALADVESDLRGRPTLGDYREAFRHLYAAAAPLRDLRVEPRAVGA